MATLMTRFYDLKLRTKFLLSFTVIVLLTIFMISTVNYYVSMNAIKRNTANFSEYLIEQIGINLEKRTKDIEDHVFQQFRNSSLSAALSISNNSSATDLFTKDRTISEFMNELLFSRDYYMSVMVIDSTGKRFGLERSATQNYNKDLADANIDLIQEKRGRASWVPGSSNVIFMEKAIYDIASNRYVGIIIVGVDSSLINAIYSNVDELTQGNIVILNEELTPLLLNKLESAPSRYFVEHRMYETQQTNQGFQYGGEAYISTIITTPYDKWKIIQIIAVNELKRGTEAIKLWTVSTIAVALLIAFILAVIISKNITENVRMLLQSMTNFSVDFTHKRIVARSRDEVGLLAEKFNSMAEKIGELIHTVYEEKLLKQKAEYRTLQFEYKALQAQINPHFLYNTLESIHSLAKLSGDKQVSDMIYLLGKLLRESIGKKGDIIPLQDEVDYITSYLAIHKIIYGDKIEVNVHVEPSLMSLQVPKFILQPLVENSIKHGIEEKPGKGIVSIGCWVKDEDLYLEVSDNGVGIDEETKSQLLSPSEGSQLKRKDKHTNVGIISVHKRIQILYGDRYGLSITSELHHGTSIRIRLPILTEEAS
ncbi:sensor histidine kinase [Paenibacillus sp. HJGM_3]|uniref:sensor histidine kinase n=1 Tax=Paenibacillus sp. HJGM_3 TaxID=3379816 RepID=UPI0038591704